MTKPPASPGAVLPGKLLALDVGLARIGVAACDPLGLAARPLTILRRRSRNEDFAALARLVETEQAEAVICGLPLHMDGSEGAQAQSVRRWAMRLAHALRALLGRPTTIIFWDERLTTLAAQQLLAEAGDPREALGKADMEDDDAAAAVILQSYLDARRRGDPVEFGRIDLPPKEN